MENRREYIPGCERYTLASEIDSLKKYLKRGIENRDENLDLPMTNLGTPVDQKLGKVTDLSGRREDLTIGKGTTELPKSREKLEIGAGPEVLPGTRESLEIKAGPEALPKGRESLEDISPDLTELPGSRETLTDTSQEITELPAGTAVSLPESVPSGSGDSSEITSLSGESDRVNLELPRTQVSLDKSREPLEGSKSVSLDKSRESLEIKAGPSKLPKDSEGLEVPAAPASLPKTRESLETPAGPSLDKSRESLEVPSSPGLETDRTELEIPAGPELSKSREELEVGQIPDLDKSRESLEVPGTPELVKSRDPLEAIKNVDLVRNRKELEAIKEVPLDKSREPLEGAKDVQLEKSRESLEALKNVSLEKSRETLEVPNKNALDTSRESLEAKSNVTKLPTEHEELEVPSSPGLEENRAELDAPGVQNLDDSRESLEVPGSPELPTDRLGLETPGSPDLRESRESLEVQGSAELEKDAVEVPGNIPEPDLPTDSVGLNVPGSPDLEDGFVELQDTRNISLPESREEITDSSEVELGTEALGLEVPEDPGLSDKSETLEVPGSPELETDRVDLLDDSWQEELISGLTEPQQIKKPEIPENTELVEGLQDYQKISDLTQIKALIPGLKDSQKLVDDSWKEELSNRRDDLEDTSWKEELVTGLTEPQELTDDSWTEELVPGLEKEQELLDDSWVEKLVDGYRSSPGQELNDDSWKEELVSGYRKDPDQELLDDSWQEELVTGYRKDPDQELLDDSWQEELVSGFRDDPGQELNDDSWKEELVDGYRKDPGQELNDDSWKEELVEGLEKEQKLRDDSWEEELVGGLEKPQELRDDSWTEELVPGLTKPQELTDDSWQEELKEDSEKLEDTSGQDELSDRKEEIEKNVVPGLYNVLEGIPAYKLDGNFASYLNPSKYIRWAVEQAVNAADALSPDKLVGGDIIKGSIKQRLLDETLHALVAARDLAEKALGMHRYRLPGGSGLDESAKNLIRQGMSGDISVNSVIDLAQDTAANLLSSAAVQIDNPINRPDPKKTKEKEDIFESLEGPRKNKRLDVKSKKSNPAETSKAKELLKKALGSNRGLNDYIPFYYKDRGSKDLAEKLDHLGRNNRLGLGGTLEALCKETEIVSFAQLKELLENSDYITTASRGIGKRSSNGTSYAVNTMTLDSNHVWEIIFEPYCGPENGMRSYLPSIHQINYENFKSFGYNTCWDTWVPFTSFELTSKKMVQKSINLYAGEISIPQNLEFTNELRLVICDDQYKSWKRYFDYVMYASSYYTKIHLQSEEYYQKKFTETDQTFTDSDLSKYSKGVIRPAPYKNLAFRCKILCMNPQYQTLNVSDLLVVLKEFTEEWQGEVDASPTELAAMFSVVGENPSSLTEEDLTGFNETAASEDADIAAQNAEKEKWYAEDEEKYGTPDYGKGVDFSKYKGTSLK